MEQKILGINTEFGSLKLKNLEEYSFSDKISFLDYDVVIISTDCICNNYADGSSIYENKKRLSNFNSSQIQEDFSRIKEQIIEFLKAGKNIFVLLGNNENCVVFTGKKEYSGNGKNARITNIVTEFDMHSFLPLEITISHICGEKFEICCQPPFATFFNKTQELTHYLSIFETDSRNALLKISTNTNKAVSAVFELYQGKIILLPMPYLEDEYLETKIWKQNGKRYLNELFKLAESLSASDSYVLPTWTDKISILAEEKEKLILAKELDKLKRLQNSIKKQETLINKTKQYKTLVSASGKVLEEIVKKVIEELGFTILDSEQGRSDLIAQYKSTIIAAEIKGVTKSAAEKHAAQLEKWVAQYIDEKEITPKPLLIVNGFCDIPLSERTEEVFPHQMLKYSEARNHCLITTTQLLCLYIETKNNPTCLEERIEELLKTIGKYNRYLVPQEFITYLDYDKIDSKKND